MSSADLPTTRDTAVARAGRRNASNLIWLTLASSAQIVIQFLIQVVVAYQFGARADTDSLAAALVVPTLLSAIIAGSLSYALVPELVSCFADEARSRVGWSLATSIGLITAMVSLFVSLGVLYGSDAVVHLLYGHMTSDQQQLSSQLLSILSWQVFMSTLVSWSLAIHHSRHSFIIPAVGGVIGTGLTLLIAMAMGHKGIHWIAHAINAGSALSTIIHVFPYVSSLRLGQIERERMQRLWAALLPLVVGSIYLRIDPVVDRSLASQLSEGSVAQLHYAQRMIVALLAISTSGLSVIAFPQLAGQLAREGQDSFVEHFAIAMRRLVLITVPIAIGFSIFAVPVVSDLLERGRFTSEDSHTVGWLIVCFMGMFVGASAGELLSRGFYTLGDTRTPTVIGAAAITIGLICKWSSLSLLGVWGIACSTSLALMLAPLCMSYLLIKRLNWRLFEGCGSTLVQSLLATLAACAVCTIPYTVTPGRTWLAAPIGVVVYFGLLWIVGNIDVRALANRQRS